MTLGECEIRLADIQVQLERHASYSDPITQASYMDLAQAVGQVKASRTWISKAITKQRLETKKLEAEGKL